MRKLDEIRSDLTRCDSEIIDLLKKRLDYVREAIEYKREMGLPILSGDEKEMSKELLLEEMTDSAYQGELLEIFKQIKEQSKCVESKVLFPYNISLIGFMGAGKSTVSNYLKETLAMNEIDVDSMIVKSEQMEIKDIFEKYGEEYFRNCESNAIISLKDCSQTIISCGGGAVVREENVKNLKKTSRIVLLKASPESTLERVKNSDERPILNGNMNVEFIKELMEKRARLYQNAADIIIDTDNKTIPQVCEELIGKLLKLK